MEEIAENKNYITEKEKEAEGFVEKIAAAEREKGAVLNPKKVLVIDDDENLMGLVTMTLEDEGYDVRSAVNGVEGLKVLAQMRCEEGELPCVGYVDSQMPIMEGDEFAGYARRAVPKMPLVSCTANTGGKLAPDFVAVLGKPFDLDDLLDVTEKYAKAAARQLRTR